LLREEMLLRGWSRRYLSTMGLRGNGSFAVGPVLDGLYSITAGSDVTPQAQSRAVTAHAGDASVVLTIERVVVLTGLVLDADRRPTPDATRRR
jgi:hypothetical protein